MITCCERASLLVFLFVMFYCVIVNFPYGVLGQVLYLIILISDLCLLSDFTNCVVCKDHDSSSFVVVCFVTFDFRSITLEGMHQLLSNFTEGQVSLNTGQI